jgi:hypothetical protein
MAAVRRIQQINTAESTFLVEHKRFGGADELTLDAELKSACEIGYTYAIQLNPKGYAIQARPRDFPAHGRRSFYSDQTFLIRQAWKNGPATLLDPELR